LDENEPDLLDRMIDEKIADETPPDGPGSKRHIRHEIEWFPTEISHLTPNSKEMTQPTLRCLDCHSIILKDITKLTWCFPNENNRVLSTRLWKNLSVGQIDPNFSLFVEHISLNLSNCAFLNFREGKSYQTFAFQYYPIAKWWKKELLKFTDGSVHSHLPENILPPGLNSTLESNQKLLTQGYIMTDYKLCCGYCHNHFGRIFQHQNENYIFFKHSVSKSGIVDGNRPGVYLDINSEILDLQTYKKLSLDSKLKSKEEI